MKQLVRTRSPILLVAVSLICGFALFSSLSSASVDVGTQDSNDFNPTVDERVVQSGDTLWEIADEVLGDPLMWPRVWALNPEITNPHWIYPGDIIRFYRSTIPLPTLYEHTNIARAGEIEQETGSVDNSVLVDEVGGELATNYDFEDSETPMVSSIEEVNPPPIEMVTLGKQNAFKGVFSGVFVSPTRMKSVGEISNAAPDRDMLSVSDRVFVALEDSNSTKAGDSFMTFEELGEVKHPSSGDFSGYLTRVTGKILIEKIKDDVAMGRVSKIYTGVSRGQLVTPFVQEPFSRVTPNKGPSRKIQGEIIVIAGDERKVGGLHGLVVIDRGAKHGVVAGNRFAVWGKPDPRVVGNDVLGDDSLDARFRSGELLVLSVHNETATCSVTKSIKELSMGDSVTSIGRAILPSK